MRISSNYHSDMTFGDFKFSEVDFNPNPNSILLRLLNQIKHTAQSFAQTYRLDFENLKKFLNNEECNFHPIVAALISHPGIDIRVLLKPDVAEKVDRSFNRVSKVAVMSAEDTRLSARVFSRGPTDDEKVPFYTYFDTAVRPTSPFRPELIEQLIVSDGECDLENSYFNNGHFEDQLTLFLGDVNLHWKESDGRQRVFKATRLSTSYTIPFIPHTFTSRSNNLGRILAVTYVGLIANPSFLDKAQAHSLEDLCQLLQNYEPSKLLNQHAVISSNIVQELSNPSEEFQSIQLLGGIPDQPNSSIRLLRIPKGSKTALDSKSNHQWLYNCSNETARLDWDQSSFEMSPGSSIAIAPQTQYSFENTSTTLVEVACFSANPSEGDALSQAKRILNAAGPCAISRLQNENCRWLT